ncbi:MULTISPECIES: TetR/AcrR family transcriptional regulator [Prauserella salsuginis group]|uniref:AcrR family transcriptional regulator n=2 Tax=Prauserella salsuginis group TaxID=2893672 RepID=A0A839XLM8_9PSEU|nr:MULTISPECIES: TetR/AcrR family transcriptional regulator [Prauserella salsuginis group]MBB3663527.1 AcrR family transcriptional regulator [Prauserella sediminis]MCR3720654.1 transcriptional regulator, TetR family [Prauserella flava]MCR3735265.1 transcriptional regulator, TetR family [Prauserella salsuginis]
MAVTKPAGGRPARERVHRAAVRLFATKGFHGTGIRDLAKAADLSSASLYHYMPTKERLLADIMRTSLQSLLDAALGELDGVDDPVERLDRLVALHVTRHAREPMRTRVVDNEVDALTPASRRDVVGIRDSYEKLWSDTIDDGLHSGVFTTTRPATTRLALLDMCNGVARWFSPGGELGRSDLADHYADLARRMVGAPPRQPR